MKRLCGFLLLCFLVACQPSEEDKISKIIQSQSSDFEKLQSISEILFHGELKEFHFTDSPSSNTPNSIVEILHGGSSGLTFLDQMSYKIASKRNITNIALQLFYFISKIHQSDLRLSLSKPFYIQNEPNADSILQEFEIYRVYWSFSDYKLWLNEYPNYNPKEKNIPLTKDFPPLDDFEKKAKIELDEFYRVELK